MIRWLLDLPAASQRWPHPNDGRVRICDRFADVPVQNQFGWTYRFHRDFVGGRMLIINTMYTTCRGSCPTTSRTIEKLRTLLSPALGPSLAFLSISLEPEVDTVEVLHEYASQYGAGKVRRDLAPWHFLTGTPANMTQLRKSLGMYDLNPKVDADITRHEATLLFGNCDRDRWGTLPAALRWPLLVEGIRRMLGTTLEQQFGFALPHTH